MVHTAQTSGTGPGDEFLMYTEHIICLSEGQHLTDEVIGYVWWILTLCRRYCKNKVSRVSGDSKLRLGETQANLGTS